MLNSELVKKAHEMAREIKAQYPEVDYRFQYGLCLSYLLNKGEVEMVELKGSEKQIAWATEIKENLITEVEKHKNNFLTSKASKRNYILDFKQEIINHYEKPTTEQAIDYIAKMFEILLESIKNETSARRLIDISKTSCSILFLKEEFIGGPNNKKIK